jgi:predicted amidohydrolase
VWGNPAENRLRLQQQIEAHPGADLYVLTEMWSTGFATNPEGVAEHNEEDATETADGSQTNGSTNASEMRVKGTVNLDNAQAA